MMPLGRVFNKIVRMNRGFETRSRSLFQDQPCKFHPLPVYPNAAAVGLGGKCYRRYRLNHIPKLFFSQAQRILGPSASCSIACLAQPPPPRGYEPRHAGLQNIIGRPDLKSFDSCLFAKRARNKDERQIGADTQRQIQRGKSVERRKFIVREDQVKFGAFKSCEEVSATLHAGYSTDEMIGFKKILYEPGVVWIILQQQDTNRHTHNT